MKRIFVTALVLLLAAMLVACGGKDVKETPATPPPPAAPEPEPVAPAPPAPAPEEGPEQAAPVEGEANVIDKATDEVLGGGEMQDIGSKVERVACSDDERKVTFEVINVGENVWNLDQNAPFVSKEEKNVKIFINGYEANRGTPQYHPDTGEVMFGPNELFSDNCGGVTKITPGESVTCTLLPVKLNRGTGTDGLKKVNEIWIDSPSIDDYLEFTCE